METNSSILPIDMLVEIALRTSDPYDILKQCDANKLLADKCRDNTQFWKTWIQNNNPELFLLLNYGRKRGVYDQIFLTHEGVNIARRDILITSINFSLNEMSRIQRKKEESPLDTFRLKLIKFKKPSLIPVFIKFRPILDQDEFFVCTQKYIQAYETSKSDPILVGVYNKDEVKENMDKLDEPGGNVIDIININMNKFTIGEFTTVSPKQDASISWRKHMF